MTKAVTAGGLLMIGTLILMFILIFSETLPLWKPGRASLEATLATGEGLTAFAAGIPRLQNGRQIFRRPDHRHGAAAAIDKHHRLAGRVKRLEQIHLHGGQRNIRAVAAAKSDVIHRHLLAFKLRIQAAYIDDHVCRRR